jgi:DNA polymerase-1
VEALRRVFVTNETDIELLDGFFWQVFAFDTETENERFLRTGQMSQGEEGMRWSQQIVIGASISDGNTTAYFDFLLCPQLVDWLRPRIESATLLFGHNIVYDTKALKRVSIDVVKQTAWYDTMVALHLLDENSEKGLKWAAKEYLGETETITYLQARKQGYSSEKFYNYACNDAEWTWRLAQVLSKRIADNNLTFLMNQIEMPFLKCVAEIEMNGMLVDKARADRIRAELGETATKLELKLYEIIGAKYSLQTTFPDMKVIVTSDVNLGSPEQIRKILFQDLGFKPTIKTETGKDSTGVKVLEALKGQHPFVDTLLEYRVVQKLRSAFFEPLTQFVDGDGRVRSHYNDVGTKTGRLSSSGPNMQQLPRPREGFPNTRSCFVAQTGYKFIGCDYSGQEIRVMAHLSGDEILLDALRKEKDIHLATANQFFNLGIPEEELYESHPNFKKQKKKHDVARSRAKAITFGIAYGKSAFGFAQDFKISEEEAQGILDRYFAGFPKVKEAIDACHKTLRLHGAVRTMVGRARHFRANEQGFYPGSAYRESFNFLIQSYSADMIRMAAIATRKLSIQHPEWGMRIVATIHDENVYEVREEHAEAAAQAIKEAFETVVQLKVPMVSSVSVGNNLGELK